MHAPARASIAIGLLLAVLGVTGCLGPGEPETHEVRIETWHDPSQTDPDERSQTPGEGSPARNGTVNAFLFTAEDFEAMEGTWGLWDPVAPPAREPGDELVLPANRTGAFPLDDQGVTGFDVDAPEGTVLALWVWGSQEANGAHDCEGDLFYVSPDEPAATLTITENQTASTSQVPFGLGCSKA